MVTFSSSGSWRCRCCCGGRCSGAVILVRAVPALAFSITAVFLRNAASAVALESVLRTNCKRTLTQDSAQRVQTDRRGK